jgi:hypothetical protein
MYIPKSYMLKNKDINFDDLKKKIDIFNRDLLLLRFIKNHIKKIKNHDAVEKYDKVLNSFIYSNTNSNYLDIPILHNYYCYDLYSLLKHTELSDVYNTQLFTLYLTYNACGSSSYNECVEMTIKQIIEKMENCMFYIGLHSGSKSWIIKKIVISKVESFINRLSRMKIKTTDKSIKCVICMESLCTGYKLKCCKDSYYHQHCLFGWFHTHNNYQLHEQHKCCICKQTI